MTLQYHINAVVITHPHDAHDVAARLQDTVSALMLDRDPPYCDYVSVSISTLDIDEDDEPVNDAKVTSQEDMVER